MASLALNRVSIRGNRFRFTPARLRIRREADQVVCTFWPQGRGMSYLEVAAPPELAALAAIHLLRASGLAGRLGLALDELEQELHQGGNCAAAKSQRPAHRS
jgi:hypothetical protein